MTWDDYFRRHAEEAERKAQQCAGFARQKQNVVAETFRRLAQQQFTRRSRSKQPREARSRFQEPL